MLTTLRIKNLALVADLTLELQPGYNVITGETGAGKSILIGALSLVLGERADRTLIRSGSDSCSVEAVFDVTRLRAPLKSFLEDNGLEPCEDQQLVLKRAFTGAGANRQFINGSPSTLAALASLGEWLVDIHGPHEHQSLLHPARQLDILDAFGKLEHDRAEFAELVRRRAALETEKAALIVDEKTYAQQLDLLRFQVSEIAAARLQPDEETQVEQEHRRGSNSARLLQLSQAALELLAENETSLLTQAGIIGRTLQELQRIDTSAAALLALHEQTVSLLRDLQNALSHYTDKVEVDPARLQQLEERLNLIHSLKRKYGATLTEVLGFGEEARRKLESLEQRDAELARINTALEKLEAELARAGQALSAKRRKVIPQLSKAAGQQLADLGFKQSRFDVALRSDEGRVASGSGGGQLPSRVTRHASPSDGRAPAHPKSLNSSGFDTVEFQFAPNPGEPPRPLRAIASSGELARVMLALKTVLAAEDQIPVLVFDEVDANVGGETANAVGEKMRQLAQKRQVLCITHLPQVAATATAHFVATKQLKAGRTISEITLLDKQNRVTELTRMLGGQTEAARKHAEALLKT
ncbi:MAG TPA: DNA repair protein RecN [Candidatus Binatia bacterium]|jgi:DNA repair protein RecN (Recombination protein N)|nr:DNA repair protein RecN [Candidatus Binatia bacterium]